MALLKRRYRIENLRVQILAGQVTDLIVRAGYEISDDVTGKVEADGQAKDVSLWGLLTPGQQQILQTLIDRISQLLPAAV